jgi:hypothetical protein
MMDVADLKMRRGAPWMWKGNLAREAEPRPDDSCCRNRVVRAFFMLLFAYYNEVTERGIWVGTSDGGPRFRLVPIEGPRTVCGHLPDVFSLKKDQVFWGTLSSLRTQII